MRKLKAAEPLRAERTRAGDASTKSARTRAKLLEKALVEFSKRGFEGARVDTIAAEAKINKAMIYHYFGSKDDLYVAVLEHAYEAIRERERELDLTHLPPVEGIQRLAAFTFSYLLENPWWIALLNDENMHRASHLRRSRRVRVISTPLIETITDLLDRGMKEGVFRSGVDPRHVYLLLSGMCYFYVSNAHTLSLVLERELLSPKARSGYLGALTEAVLAYLRPA